MACEGSVAVPGASVYRGQKMSVRWFNRSRLARGVAGTAVVLGMVAMLARLIRQTRVGAGLIPYSSALGAPVYPVTALLAAVVILAVAVLTSPAVERWSTRRRTEHGAARHRKA